MKEKQPLVSVIIPSWNRKSDLKRALRGIFSQDYKPIEVIVTDNGSTDGTAEMVRKNFKKVHLIANKENLGVSKAKNQGIKASRGSYILFCDSDIEMFNKRCISIMVQIMQEHQDIGALGGEAYILPDGKTISKKKMITPNCETSTIVMPNNDYLLEGCGYVATCNCMMPKTLLYDCGGFDESIIYGGEDKEMGLKLKKQGYKSIVDSRCLVYHHISQSTSHWNFYALNKNRIRIAIRNYSLLHIIALPVLDIIYSLSPKKFKDLKSDSVDVTKYVKGKNVEKQGIVRKVLVVGGSYAWSVARAYGWNILHLPRTIGERIKKQDYLKV